MQEAGPDYPSLRQGLVGFTVAVVVLVPAVIVLVASADTIASTTGIASTFVEVALLAIVPSLPEYVACLSAVRVGSYDLAVGNLFGPSVFNMLALGVSAAFLTSGSLLGAVDPDIESARPGAALQAADR